MSRTHTEHVIERQTWASEIEIFDLVDGELECVRAEGRGPVKIEPTLKCTCGRAFEDDDIAAEHLRTARDDGQKPVVMQ